MASCSGIDMSFSALAHGCTKGEPAAAQVACPPPHQLAVGTDVGAAPPLSRVGSIF